MEIKVYDFVLGLGHGGKLLSSVIGDSLKISKFAINLAKDNFNTISKKDMLYLSDEGTGSNPSIGTKTALENLNNINEFLEEKIKDNFDLGLVVVGLGGGSGSGILPVVLDYFKKIDKSVNVLLTLPLKSEGMLKKHNAIESVNLIIDKHINDFNFIVVDNEYLLKIFGTEKDSKWNRVNSKIANSFVKIQDLINQRSVDFKTGNNVVIDRKDIHRILKYKKGGFIDILRFREKKIDEDNKEMILYSLFNFNKEFSSTMCYLVSFIYNDETTLKIIEDRLQFIELKVKTPQVYKAGYYKSKENKNDNFIIVAGLTKMDVFKRVIKQVKQEKEKLKNKKQDKFERIELEQIDEF